MMRCRVTYAKLPNLRTLAAHVELQPNTIELQGRMMPLLLGHLKETPNAAGPCYRRRRSQHCFDFRGFF